MKKIFLVLVCTLFLGQIGNAQFLRNIESTYKEQISNLIKGEVKGNLKFSINTVKDKYITKEQPLAAFEESEDNSWKGTALPNEETSVTDSYMEVKISIPKGYKINKYIMVDADKDNNDPRFSFPLVYSRTILLHSNNKDVSFQLDYSVEFKDKDSITEIPTEYIDQALELTIRFSPKYFTFTRDDNYKNEKQVNVEYEGETVTLNVETEPVLMITTPSGVEMSYILEPKWQNIYNDFKFVREGHNN